MNYSINPKNKAKRELEIINDKFIQDLIQMEFIDSCENILIQNQQKFIEEYFKKIYLIIKHYYGDDILVKIKPLNKIIYRNKIDFVKNIYSPMHRLCSLGLKQFNSNNNLKNLENIKISFLYNYLPHCMKEKKNNNNMNSKNIAIHTCGGKFIIITDLINNNNNINESRIKNNSYIICTKCKKCYFPKSIPMICSNCCNLFYSQTIPESIKNNNCYLATWSKYHCKNMNNEKMSCLKCGEDFWIKDNKLFCKKCKFEIEPNNIIWTCILCKTDFNSNAKIYNPLEFKETQLILKEALIYKKIAKPMELPCKCVLNPNQIEQLNFYHRPKNNNNKKECKGILYFSEINNKKFIVCSTCYNIYSINKFRWDCPMCFKSFTTLKIKVFNLKEKNNIIFKNIKLKNNNNKNQSFKNTSRKKINTISILDTDNSYSNKNNNKSINKINTGNNRYLSPSKNEINSLKIRNVKSYIKKKPKNIHRISSCYSSSSKDLLIKNNSNRINNISHNRNLTNNNSNNKIVLNKIMKNNTINNECLYSLNIKKRRNLSEIPNEMKNDIYFIVSKNKHENKYNSGTGSTIFSSLSNYNLNSQNETLIRPTLEQNLNNKKIIMKTVEINNNNTLNNLKNINNYNLHKNPKINISDNKNNNVYFKNYKRNILYNNKNIYNLNYSKNINKGISTDIRIKSKNNSVNINNINTINTDKNCKILNSNLISPKNFAKVVNIKSLENPIEYNETENYKVFRKKLSKKKKGHKSFYLKDKNFILFSPENDSIKSKENSKYRIKKIENLNSDNIYELNKPQLEISQKIHHINKYLKRSDEFSYFNYSLNNKENTDKFNKKNKPQINNLTINNSCNYNINQNNLMHSDYYLKKKKNISFEKVCKIKNINISINSHKLNNIINYNLSFSNNLKNALLHKNKKNNNISMSSKMSINKGNISYTQTNNSNSNKKENNKLKSFNFDDYIIITQLGQGSFGKIYLVKDSKGNIYSMKKILLSEELDVKNVIAEYNMCYNMSHPNIIKILGIYSNKLDKTTFVVYVLMEVGISDWEKEINSYKTKKNFYSESDLINILKQLVSSLCFLQKNNISHRDIKPQNILIFKNKIYKLTDFGEARRIKENDKNNKSLIQYSLKGTELYMSPLLFNGLRTGQIDIKHNTYKSDVYSLGLCMLYASTTCDKKLFEIRRMIEMEKIKKFINISLKDNYSDRFIDLITSMLDIHEQNRPDFIELEKIMESF